VTLFFLCSRSDVITGAGGTAVNGFDPTLTDLAGGFMPVTIYSDYVVSAFSYRDSLSGTHQREMEIGRSGEGDDTLAAHAQFAASAGDSALSARYAEDSGYVVSKWAYIYFRADSAPDAPVALYGCGFLPDTLSPVKRGWTRGEGGAYKPDTLLVPDTAAPGDGGLLFDSAATASALLRDSLTNILYRARLSGGRDTSRLAFCVAGYGGSVRRIDNPYIILAADVRRGDHRDGVKYDTIPAAYVRYTAFETAVDSLRRSGTVPDDGEVYSSHRTGRTAVFNIRTDTAYNKLLEWGLSGGGNRFLHGVVSVRQRLLERADGEGDSVKRVDTEGIGYRGFAVADTLPLCGALCEERALREGFRMVGTAASAAYPKYNTLEFKTADTAFAATDSARRLHIYVYLRPVERGGVVQWARERWEGNTDREKKTPKVDAIFMPSRQR
jgi:hypothetical protein